MIVASEHQTKLRQKEIQEIDRKASKEHEEAKKNSNFTQTYPKGWQRIRELVRDKQGAAAIGLYSFFAEHIDPTCGAVVCDQQFLANQMGVSTRTIRRWLDYLEEKGALVRIPVAGKVCAYALDPHEVWKGYNTSKDYSAFVTKTLVNKDGEIKRRIMAMFSGGGERSRAVAKRLLTAQNDPTLEKGDGSPQRAIPMISNPLSSKSHK